MKHSLPQESAMPAPSGRRGGGSRLAERGPVEERRARILEKAAARIARHGFEATTVRQIADDVQILSGSLYHHFATKDEILLDVVRPAANRLREETLRIAAGPAAAEVRLVALVLMELGELVRSHDAHAILYNERKLLRTRDEFAEIRVAKTEVYLAWRTLVEEGVAAGEFDRELDVFQAIRTIMRMLNSAADWYTGGEAELLAPDQTFSFERVEEFYVRFILRAVRDPARALAALPTEQARSLLEPAPDTGS